MGGVPRCTCARTHLRQLQGRRVFRHRHRQLPMKLLGQLPRCAVARGGHAAFVLGGPAGVHVAILWGQQWPAPTAG